MQRLTLFLISTIAIGLGFNCGGGKESVEGCPADKVTGHEQILNESERPNWVSNRMAFGKYGETKYALFYGIMKESDETVAVQNAKGAALANAAEAFEVSIKSQWARAFETYGTGEELQKEEVTKGLQAYKAEVTLTGIDDLGSYVERVQRIEAYDPSSCEPTKTLITYNAYVLKGMEYSRFQALRDGETEKQIRNLGPEINDTQARLLEEAAGALKELDSKPCNEWGTTIDGRMMCGDVSE